MRLRYIEHRGKKMEAEIKLIVTDLDGTLLTKKDEVHPDNIRALRRCQERRDQGIPRDGKKLEGDCTRFRAGGV